MQYNILAGNPFAFFAGQFKPYRRRHLKPRFSGRHAASHIRRADSGRERSQCTVGTGMRIRTYDDIPRGNKPSFGQQSVLYAHIAAIVKVLYSHIAGEFPAFFTLFRRLYILIRHEMVHNKRNFLFIKNSVYRDFPELINRHGSGNVIAENHIHIRKQQLSRLYIGKSGMRR